MKRAPASPPALPAALVLPSGLAVRIDPARAAVARARAKKAARRRAGEDGDAPTDFAEALAALATPGLLATRAGEALDARALALRDANVLRAVLARSGVVREREARVPCENCGAELVARSCAALELGPFVDGELDDPELDAAFAFGEPQPLPPVPVAARGARARVARSVTLAPRTLGEAEALWRAADAGVTELTPALVAAAGVAALGRERRASVVAEALSRASPAAWTEFVHVFEQAHYGGRLASRARCGACGATNRFVAPFARELEPDLDRDDEREREGEGFPDEAAFAARVERIGARVYRAMGVRNIELVVEPGVPDCDDGGEPLLGSYTPPGVSALEIPEPPRVKIYYRTFREELRGAPDAEVDAEIRETIEHELEHHLHFLAGYDPMDAEERAEIAREEARRVGRSELARRQAKGALATARAFARATWPLWLLVAGFTAWRACADT